MIRGKLRVLPGVDAMGFVACDRGTQMKDVLIPSKFEQNRALDGDEVFVELLPPEEAGQPNKYGSGQDAKDERITKAVASLRVHNGENSDDEDDDDDDDYEAKADNKAPLWQDDDVQMSLWAPVVAIEKRPLVSPSSLTGGNAAAQEQRQGRVVCVVHPKSLTELSELAHIARKDKTKQTRRSAPIRRVVGSMIVMRRANGNAYLLTPTNRSLPQFICPGSFRLDADQLKQNSEEGLLFKAEYVYGTWKEAHRWPPCVNVQQIGRSCNVEDETEALLIENGVDHGDFPAAVLNDVQQAVDSGLAALPSDNGELEWRPTPDMYKGRRDYRQQRIFTIDPTTARDLDDALHITELPDGRIELGVHIADVSYFVHPDTAVDSEATRRATTVYLVDRVLPMLPRPLCEVACSLNENVERLAFSCVWIMNKDGTLEDKRGNRKSKATEPVWYGRSVIKSCARLDYATAQNIIDGKVACGEEESTIDEDLWPASRRPTGGHTIGQVARDVRLMHKVAMARRKLRFQNGALALNGIKLAFKLDSDGETPSMCAAYPIRDSNRLVEEYMLLANYLVAQRLITHAGGLALIRNHSPPLMEGMDSVVDIAKTAKGFVIDASSSKTLQQSLNRLARESDDELVMQCITELLMAPMRPAEYHAASNMEDAFWRHFALNIPYYTHFTSPIRRYADIVVHRLLQATLDEPDGIEDFPLDEATIEQICGHCNEKKMASKAAQDRSDRVFLALYVKRNPIKSKLGVVLSVGDKTFVVFVPSLGVSAKVFVDEQKDLFDAEPYLLHGKERRITLTRKGRSTGNHWLTIDVKVFVKLQVSVHCKETPPIDVKIKLEGPWKDGK